MSLTANLVGFGWVWTLLGALFIALMMYLASEANMQRFLHLLQLESYQLDGYGRSVKRNARMDVWPAWGCALVYAALCLGGFVLQAVLQAALYNLIVGALYNLGTMTVSGDAKISGNGKNSRNKKRNMCGQTV